MQRDKPFNIFGMLPEMLLRQQRIEHPNAQIAGEMVVASARFSKRRLFRARPDAGMALFRRQTHHGFEHAGHVSVGQ